MHNPNRISPRTEDELEYLIQKLTDILAKKQKPPEQQILGDEERLSVLKCSKRTLATYRDEGLLLYSKIRGKIYYKLSDVLDMLDRHKEQPPQS
jgi:hypothetical protein